jgi:hypothetical protein
VSRGGAAYRPETLRHTPRKLTQRKARFAERYPARCRTDRCRWAASSLPAPSTGSAGSAFAAQLTDRVWASNQGGRSGDQAAALRPPDLVSITRGLGPAKQRARLGGPPKTPCQLTLPAASWLKTESALLRRRRHTGKELPDAPERSFRVRRNRLEIATNPREHVGEPDRVEALDLVGLFSRLRACVL